jgi:hypothetical protein
MQTNKLTNQIEGAAETHISFPAPQYSQALKPSFISSHAIEARKKERKRIKRHPILRTMSTEKRETE